MSEQQNFRSRAATVQEYCAIPLAQPPNGLVVSEPSHPNLDCTTPSEIQSCGTYWRSWWCYYNERNDEAGRIQVVNACRGEQSVLWKNFRNRVETIVTNELQQYKNLTGDNDLARKIIWNYVMAEVRKNDVSFGQQGYVSDLNWAAGRIFAENPHGEGKTFTQQLEYEVQKGCSADTVWEGGSCQITNDCPEGQTCRIGIAGFICSGTIGPTGTPSTSITPSISPSVTINPSLSPTIAPSDPVPSVTITPTTTPINTSPTPTINPNITSIPTSTPAPGQAHANLSVKVVGIGNDLSTNNQLPKNPSRTVRTQVFNSENNLVASVPGTLVYGGLNFVGLVNLGENITQGSYTLKVRLGNTLWRRIPGILVLAPDTTRDTQNVRLVSAELDGNNMLDLIDYQIFLSCFNKETTPCTTEKSIFADINDDGVIDQLDYNILLISFETREGD